MAAAPPPIPDEDDWRWEREATDLRHSSLTTVRSVAEKWAGSIAALLGVFSVAAVVKGPEKLADIENGPLQITLILLVGVAAASAFVAILLAALAAQGLPRVVDVLDGVILKAWSQQRARLAIRLLFWSRIVAATAALLIIASALIAWADVAVAGGEQKAAQSVLVVDSSGKVFCGEIQGTDGALRFAGQTDPLKDVISLLLVDTCP